MSQGPGQILLPYEVFSGDYADPKRPDQVVAAYLLPGGGVEVITNSLQQPRIHFAERVEADLFLKQRKAESSFIKVVPLNPEEYPVRYIVTQLDFDDPFVIEPQLNESQRRNPLPDLPGRAVDGSIEGDLGKSQVDRALTGGSEGLGEVKSGGGQGNGTGWDVGSVALGAGKAVVGGAIGAALFSVAPIAVVGVGVGFLIISFFNRYNDARDAGMTEGAVGRALIAGISDVSPLDVVGALESGYEMDVMTGRELTAAERSEKAGGVLGNAVLGGILAKSGKPKAGGHLSSPGLARLSARQRKLVESVAEFFSGRSGLIEGHMESEVGFNTSLASGLAHETTQRWAAESYGNVKRDVILDAASGRGHNIDNVFGDENVMVEYKRTAFLDEATGELRVKGGPDRGKPEQLIQIENSARRNPDLPHIIVNSERDAFIFDPVLFAWVKVMKRGEWLE